MISGGDIFGRVYETALVTHWIMLPPKAKGTITYIAPHGQYTITEEVLTVEFIGKNKRTKKQQVKINFENRREEIVHYDAEMARAPAATL